MQKWTVINIVWGLKLNYNFWLNSYLKTKYFTSSNTTKRNHIFSGIKCSYQNFFFYVLQCQVNNETGIPEDELSPEAVELCRKLGSNSTRVSEIAGGRDRVVYAAIQEGINRVNEKSTSNAQRIQKWTVLEKDFSIPGGELGE